MTRAARVSAIIRADIKVAFRDFEQLLLIIGLPVLFLVFFTKVEVLTIEELEPIDFLTPGVLTLGLLSIAFVRLAIGLGFDRTFGAIRRFSMTPLRSSEFLAAKILVTFFLLVIQTAIISITAVVLGWNPELNFEVFAAMALGVIIFSALAFAVGGLFEGLTALAIANSLYIVLLLFSGLIVEIEKLPIEVVDIVRALPSTALAEILRNGFTGEANPQWPWYTLAAWAFFAPIVAVKIFRWK